MNFNWFIKRERRELGNYNKIRYDNKETRDHCHNYIDIYFVFFSGSETALTAANKTKFKTEADKGDKKQKAL